MIFNLKQKQDKLTSLNDHATENHQSL